MTAKGLAEGLLGSEGSPRGGIYAVGCTNATKSGLKFCHIDELILLKINVIIIVAKYIAFLRRFKDEKG